VHPLVAGGGTAGDITTTQVAKFKGQGGGCRGKGVRAFEKDKGSSGGFRGAQGVPGRQQKFLRHLSEKTARTNQQTAMGCSTGQHLSRAI